MGAGESKDGGPLAGSGGFPAPADIARFVYEEARLLDSGRYDEWLELFAADGRYWLPLRSDQSEGRLEQSIADEDRLLLRIRVERLRHPRAYSMHPRAACQHVLQAPAIERIDEAASMCWTRTPFTYAEAKGEDQLVLLGVASHRLRFEGGRLRIVLKRVDLLNADAALPAILLFI